MQEIGKGIYEFKNFISKDTAKFLIDSFSAYLEEPQACLNLDNQGCIHGDQVGKTIVISPAINAPRQNKKDMIKPAGYKIEDANYNIALDITEQLVGNAEYYMYNLYQKEHSFKSLCFQLMVEGGKNGLHIDTFADQYLYDTSAILYLNDEYEGGEINFPLQQTTVKPDTGSLLIFFGDKDMPHEVFEVTSGKRYNLVCFFEPKGFNG
jgi:hypothetical protein